MEAPRTRLINLLQRHNRATVEQIAREMDLASATVRRHLDILQRDHLVTFDQVKKKTGRPEYTYYLTEAGQESLPKDYGRLLGHLLQALSSLPQAEVGNHSGEQLVQLLFQRMAQQSVARAEVKAQDSFPQRLSKTVAFLQQEKFQPEVQQTNGSVRIHLHNCPFRSVARENHSVCAYDGLILSSLLGTEVVQERCIHNDQGDCCYLASPDAQIN